MDVGLKPAEWILAGYAVLVVLTGIARLPGTPGAGWAAAAHALLLLLLWLLARTAPTRWRAIAPMALLLALYGAIDMLNGFGAVRTHDTVVRLWEHRLFGMEVSRVWWQRSPSVVWSSVLHGAYFSYYFIVPVPVAVCLGRRSTEALDRSMTAIVAAFVGCYVFFLFFPVAGPYYEFPRPAAWFIGNGPAQAVYGVLARGSSYGAAFPSSHVAATWAAVFAAWSAAPRWGAALLGPAVLLTVGVVYCQMHYGVDVLAGLLVAGLAIVTARWCHPTSSRSAPGS